MIATTAGVPAYASRFQIFDEREAFWRRLYSTESGIIKELYELKMQASDIPLFVYVARTGPNLQWTGAHRRTSTGSGASLDRQAAQDAAIGEALERYCPTYVMDLSSVVEARRPELGEPSIDPARLSLFSDAQYESPGFVYQRFTESTRVAWGVMHRLRDGARVRVPVHFVYLGYHKRSGLAEISQFISTGLACATDPSLAILKGLYEAVERDAFNIVWLNRLAMPRLDVRETTDLRLCELLAHFHRVGVKASFMLLTLDIPIPIVLCVLLDVTGARPALAVGAAANLDPVRAACKAAEEVAHTRLWTSSLRAAKDKKKYSADFREVEDFDDHVWLFDAPEMAAHAAFLSTNSTVVPLASVPNGSTGDPARDLEIARERVEHAHFDVLWKDMTTPDVAESGLCVFRTVVPGLQNINGPHVLRLLGGRRVYELPVGLGLLERPHAESQLNPVPHPFP
jgi:ribosomal protein S12 methylthiotransferase accessory factor